MGRVVVVGSLNVDLVTSVERHPGPGETVLGQGFARVAGGKGANQAVAAAAAGAQVLMVGRVGDDEAGHAYLTRLRERGVDTSGVSLGAEPTGQAWIAVDDAGENTIVVVPGANGALDSHDLDPVRAMQPGDVLLVQLEVPVAVVAEAARIAHDRDARVVLNTAPYAAVPPDVVALADPLVANEHEALELADSGHAPGSLVVTFGSKGAAWNGQEAPAVNVPALRAKDTTGAGDAFCGALAAALAAGASDEEALQAAVEAGARAVQHEGAQPDGAL